MVSPSCVWCGAADAPCICSRCRNARFCSPVCQRAAWPEHKAVCVNSATSAGIIGAAGGANCTPVLRAAPNTPLLIVGMTSLPSRLQGIGPALRSIAAQQRRPDRLIVSLPHRSKREGRDYELPPEFRALLAEYPWVDVQWVDEDFGPGTKLLGALRWFETHVNKRHSDDLLMILDDDHSYLPHALGELAKEQLARGPQYIVTFFAYFFRGLMVPQGADIIAFQPNESLFENLLEYHRTFVRDDPACFLVDDLWIGMFIYLCGLHTVSCRELVTRKGLEMIYTRTENAHIVALEALKGENRRDRVMLRAFDCLMSRLVSAGSKGLQCWGGAEALSRIQQLDTQVKHAEREIFELEKWLEQEQGSTSGAVQQAQARYAKLKHLYQLQVPNPETKQESH